MIQRRSALHPESPAALLPLRENAWRARRPAGFTLTELMVTMGIIVLLMSILLELSNRSADTTCRGLEPPRVPIFILLGVFSEMTTTPNRRGDSYSNSSHPRMNSVTKKRACPPPGGPRTSSSRQSRIGPSGCHGG